MRTLIAMARSPGSESENISVTGGTEGDMDGGDGVQESTWSARDDACRMPSFHTLRLIFSLKLGAIIRRCRDQDSPLAYVLSVSHETLRKVGRTVRAFFLLLQGSDQACPWSLR